MTLQQPLERFVLNKKLWIVIEFLVADGKTSKNIQKDTMTKR